MTDGQQGDPRADGIPALSAAAVRARELARLALSALGERSPSPATAAALIEAVARHAGLEHAAEAVAEILRDPRAGQGASRDTRRAFEAWFGTGSSDSLPVDLEGLDLEGFAAQYGSEGSLDLLDVIWSVAATGDPLSRATHHRLEDAARRLDIDPVVSAAFLHLHVPGWQREGVRLPLTSERLILGQAAECDLTLPDPQVADRHAELRHTEGTWRVTDLGSGRPTLLDGAPVTSAPLHAKSRLRLGAVEVEINGEEISARGRRSFTTLTVRDLNRRLGDVSLLDHFSVTLTGGEVVALVGPSGGGKTTLVNAILGVDPADSGEVLLDGEDFHQALRADPTIAGMVPQEDLVLPELSVEETLRYSARLRLGRGPEGQDPEEAVARVLRELDIEHIRGNRVGDALRRGISGGQRKRVNLGQELLSKSTRVIFLDEPTSGLDPLATRDIMTLLRQLADDGRIVVIVTHDLTAQAIASIDHLMVVGRGGRLAWFGPPEEACAWFGVATPDALFQRLSDRAPAEWSEAWGASPTARRLRETREAARARGHIGAPRRPGSGAQLAQLVARYARTKLRDRTGLGVLAFQPPFLAACMWVVFPAVTAASVFILSLSCLWFGMFAAVRELITDRTVWRREHRAGVAILPYVGSKVLVLALLTAAQAAVRVLLAGLGLDFAANGFSYLQLMGVCTLTSWAGMGMGLLVSAVWTSSEAAVGTLPLLLVPQILFSSILVPLRHMDPLSKAISWIMVQRYATDAALKCGETVMVATSFSAGWESRPVTGALWMLGLKPDAPDDLGLSLGVLSLAIAAFAAIMVGLAGAVVAWRGRGA